MPRYGKSAYGYRDECVPDQLAAVLEVRRREECSLRGRSLRWFLSRALTPRGQEILQRVRERMRGNGP